MEKINLCNELSFEEFRAYFQSLRKVDRIAFIRKNRSEIVKLTNAEILAFLCEENFFSALYPLVKTRSKDADEQIKHFYALSCLHPVKTRPNKEEELEIVKYAATKLEVVRFLREETNFFLNQIAGRMILGNLVYEIAPLEVTDYLFGYACRTHFPVTERVGRNLFAKASPQVIRDYLVKVGCFSGGMKHVSFSTLKSFAERKDIDAEDKFELMLLTVNRLPVITQTIHDLKKAGLFDL